jgi:hypothetical protein
MALGFVRQEYAAETITAPEGVPKQINSSSSNSLGSSGIFARKSSALNNGKDQTRRIP